MEKLTLELVESRLQELSKEHKLDIMDEKLFVLYCKKYGSLTNEIADILCPQYGFHGIYPTKNETMKVYSNSQELRKELQQIADSLNLPLNDERVGLTWTGSGKSFTPQVYKEVLEPPYFRKGQKKDTSCETNSTLTIEIMERRLLLIADELGIDVMEWRVIEEYLRRYENKFPRVITREVLSLYFDYNDDDCIPINPNRKRVGDGFYSY